MGLRQEGGEDCRGKEGGDIHTMQAVCGQLRAHVAGVLEWLYNLWVDAGCPHGKKLRIQEAINSVWLTWLWKVLVCIDLYVSVVVMLHAGHTAARTKQKRARSGSIPPFPKP